MLNVYTENPLESPSSFKIIRNASGGRTVEFKEYDSSDYTYVAEKIKAGGIYFILIKEFKKESFSQSLKDVHLYISPEDYTPYLKGHGTNKPRIQIACEDYGDASYRNYDVTIFGTLLWLKKRLKKEIGEDKRYLSPFGLAIYYLEQLNNKELEKEATPNEVNYINQRYGN